MSGTKRSKPLHHTTYHTPHTVGVSRFNVDQGSGVSVANAVVVNLGARAARSTGWRGVLWRSVITPFSVAYR